MKALYPSLISADLMNLQHEINRLSPYCTGFHVDIMDGHFVPNLTWGPMMANALGTISPKPLWVHLMVENPQMIAEMLLLAPGSLVSFHIESKNHIKNMLNCLKQKNLKASIALRPKTNVEEIFPLLDEIDQVLVMSVEPGFSGQSFLESTWERLEKLTGYRATSKKQFRIGIDGGVNADNIKKLADHGVDDFAIAAGIFKAHDAIKELQKLQQLIA